MAQASDCSYRDRIHAAGYLGVVIGGKRGSPGKSVIRLSWPSVSEAQYPTHCDSQ
ncbi:hypothetical protein BDBG_06695 [Blastomyces gilchristii SLH14081]|uniref:Uncharacterized protein n=1 Tax=Blastomyces gilchristii (strain SLH14081) TaxID=559298 RepID=A0A179USB3_BLAGS|nr:uncharacterized protein BDBG_06695 [Blastomyces gilchristii SLH14081]OAT10924.1 hypothetical protein BDBG_06695 [Blastomyces gilchristii SLH14081]